MILKPIWKSAIEIVYKCLESKVTRVDDITTKKITLLHTILHNYKCDWARYIFNYLVMFVFKGVNEGSNDL